MRVFSHVIHVVMTHCFCVKAIISSKMNHLRTPHLNEQNFPVPD